MGGTESRKGNSWSQGGRCASAVKDVENTTDGYCMNIEMAWPLSRILLAFEQKFCGCGCLMAGLN